MSLGGALMLVGAIVLFTVDIRLGVLLLLLGLGLWAYRGGRLRPRAGR